MTSQNSRTLVILNQMHFGYQKPKIETSPSKRDIIRKKMFDEIEIRQMARDLGISVDEARALV